MRATEQLGYQPDLLAQSLRRGATRTVGFIVRDISLPLFADIVKGAEQELERCGYSILLTNSLRDPALEAKHIGVLSQRRVDGLILSLQSETSMATFSALEKVRVPIVLLDREISALAADAVLYDHAAGVKEATAALLGLGHRRLGFILGSPQTRATRERLRGFLSAHEEAGVPVRMEDIRQMEAMDKFSPDFGMKAALSLLEQPSAPTAIIAGDPQLGVGLLLALKQLKLRHGGDISVVVCDDTDLLSLMEPPVSVVYRDAEAAGTVAGQLLIRRLEDATAPRRQEMLPTRFIARGSTQHPAGLRSEVP
jgi:LacI family transcriptional regulator